MSFDSFRRADPERPRYRFFPNRTRTQTVYLSWSLLGLAGVIGYLFLRNSERSQAELAVFLEGRMQQGEFLSGRNQVSITHQEEGKQKIALGVSRSVPATVFLFSFLSWGVYTLVHLFFSPGVYTLVLLFFFPGDESERAHAGDFISREEALPRPAFSCQASPSDSRRGRRRKERIETRASYL